MPKMKGFEEIPGGQVPTTSEVLRMAIEIVKANPTEKPYNTLRQVVAALVDLVENDLRPGRNK